MSFFKLNLMRTLSITLSLGSMILCFQGCTENPSSSQNNSKQPISLQTGTWQIRELRFDTATESLTTEDHALSQLHTTLEQRAFLTLKIQNTRTQVELDLSSHGTDCHVTIPTVIEYGTTHCGCSTLTLNLDQAAMEESTPGCSQATAHQSLDELFNTIHSQLGSQRVYHYAQGASSFTVDAKKGGARSSFIFERMACCSGCCGN